MRFGKAVLLTVALIAVFIAGVVSGPAIQHYWSGTDAPPAVTAEAPAAEPTATPPASAARRSPRAKASPTRGDDVVAAKKAPDTIQTIAVSVWEPELRDRAKGVLSSGARLDVAADGFDDSEQFMTVAHAARNTKVPFMVLKDGVLNRGQTLSETIEEFKPELDAKAEVRRARAAARADLELAG